jgi:hypothetical protein
LWGNKKAGEASAELVAPPNSNQPGVFVRGFRKLQEWAGSVAYGAFIAAMTLVAGLIATFYTDALKVLPIEHLPGEWKVHWAAFWFWVFVLVWFILFFARQAAESAQVQNLRGLVAYTKEAVQTLPPAGFVGLFNRITTQIRFRALPAAVEKKLEERIRTLLGMAANLAKAYDDRRDARYAANVMVFVQRKKEAPYFNLPEEKVRQFLPEDFGLEFLDGVLLLDPALSSAASEGDDKGQQDSSIEQVVFGIRSHSLHDVRWTVLPGAPMAFIKWNHEVAKISADQNHLRLELRQAVQGIDDLRKLKDLIENGIAGEQFDLENHVLEEIEKFYNKEGQKVRSFLAFPLVEGDGTLAAFGVLNIHCDMPIFLGEVSPLEAKRRQQTFAGIVTPLVFDIASAVKQWWVVVKGKYV